MRLLIHQLTRRDPSTFVGGFGVWALLCGAGLLLPGSLFNLNPAWDALQLIHADEAAWGVAMALDGILLLLSLRMKKVPQRATIAAFSAIMWFLIGCSMSITAAMAGIFSIIGAYSVYGAIGCLFAVEQWVHYPMGAEHSGDR